MDRRSAPADDRSASRPGRIVAWSVALILLAFLCIWPSAAGMVASNDDLKFVRSEAAAGPITEAIRSAWASHGMFRPLEILVGAGCDPHTLAPGTTMPVQIAGLLTLAVGIVALTRRIAPAHPVAVPLMLIWTALSPATMVSLWQMDTCSQTWSAALAVWAGVFLWRAVEAARAGRVDWRSWLALMVIFALGVNLKEIFYGWSAGIGAALIVILIVLFRSDAAAARRAALLLIPIVLLPIMHLVVRLKFSGFSGAGATDDRYAVELGQNVLMNAAVSLAGVFANGPLHLLGDSLASPLLRVLPIISMVAGICIFATALGFRMLHRSVPAAVRVRPLLLAAGAAILSLTVTLPMGSVSELYGFGANIGAGLLVVSALIMLWFPIAPDERLLCRGIALIGASVLLLVGLEGFASRAYHFELTWRYTRLMNELVLAHQRSLPTEGVSPEAAIYMGKDCVFGRSHSQYVVTPMLALGYEESQPWMNRMDPKRPVVISVEMPGVLRPGIDLLIECETMPRRAHW